MRGDAQIGDYIPCPEIPPYWFTAVFFYSDSAPHNTIKQFNKKPGIRYDNECLTCVEQLMGNHISLQ